MKYIYEVYPKRYKNVGTENTDDLIINPLDVTTRFEDLEKLFEDKIYNFDDNYVSVIDTKANKKINVITNKHDLTGWRVSLERNAVWLKKQEAVEVSKSSEDPFDNFKEAVEELPTKDGSKKFFVEDDGFHSIAKKRKEENIEREISKLESDIKAVKDNIDPIHYQAFLEDSGMSLQWLETQCRIDKYRKNPLVFIAALELFIRNYLDRAGKKGSLFEDLEKGFWYYKFMIAYIRNDCKPILVKDIDKILGL